MTLPDKTRQEILQLRRIGLSQKAISKHLKIGIHTVRKYAEQFKRIVVLADLHCGHRAGLTPPDWQWHIENSFQSKWAAQQIETWNYYVARVATLQPVDYLIINGDAIDGKGPRSGGTELITADRDQQVKMASECIKHVHAPRILMTYGTPYHTGLNEDWENQVATEVRHHSLVDIHDHAAVQVEGINFDVKHFSGSSSVPYGRFTSKAKSVTWNKIWAASHGQQPVMNIFIRSHTHFANNCGERDWHAFNTPALQGWGSKFGQRKCEGLVDWGLMWFDIPVGASCISDISWQVDTPEMACHKVVVKQW